MHVNPAARFIFWVGVLSLFAYSALAWELGKEEALGISVCLSQEEATSVLTAERDGGMEKANEVFKKSECANLGLKFTPVKVVGMVKTARGLGRIVEIEVGGEKAYWLTYLVPEGMKEV
jgi:hypothetical protein